jgi:glutamate dehydrogenase (NAD(P)+)
VDYDGYIVNESGLDIIALRKHHAETKSILNFKGAKSFPGNGKAGLELACDVLIPAALEQQLTIHNARNVSTTGWACFLICADQG